MYENVPRNLPFNALLPFNVSDAGDKCGTMEISVTRLLIMVKFVP